MKYDVVVCGGGLAGLCTAISAARLGCKAVLVQDRPVLGGNSSSEIRVPVGGASDSNPWARETGIIEELILENRVSNHTSCGFPGGLTNSLWDLTLYDKVIQETNLKLFLNTSARKAVVEKKRIRGILCYQLGSEKEFVIEGDIFIDATGDGLVAASAGAEFRIGREGKDEFGESLAPEKGNNGVMGNTLMFQAKDLGHPVSFIPPAWAIKYPKCEDLGLGDKNLKGKVESGYCWIEIGTPFDTISENEKIRDELLKHLLGVWEHIKNHPRHREENKNLALDWIGAVPGKRESRRFIGDYILSEKDVRNDTFFPDRVAYGGWFIDLHTIGGILARDKPPEPASYRGDPKYIAKTLVTPYSIPFRCLYSKNIENLMLAGRDISVSHVALGTTRLMATCAVIGQAVGTASYLCRKHKVLPSHIHPKHIGELQQQLLKSDCFIPDIKNEDKKDLAKGARVTASSSSPLVFPQEVKGSYPLDIPRGQIFPVSSSQIEEISLLLESKLSQEVKLRLGLRKAENIWDLRGKDDLASSLARVPPRKVSWVRFKLNKKVEPESFYWIYLESKEGISWQCAEGELIGVAPIEKKEGGWYWMWGWPPCIPKADGLTLAMEVKPDIFPYQGENVISGVPRVYDWTNIWISDPAKGFPQYLKLDFGQIREFTSVYLTFDTFLNREELPAFFRAPECVKDYRVFYQKNGSWELLLEVKDNYQRHRVHKFKLITSSKLRFEFLSTNGSDSIHLYEVRVY